MGSAGGEYDDTELGGLRGSSGRGEYGGRGYGEGGTYDSASGPQELPAYGERGRTRTRDLEDGDTEGFIGGSGRGLDERYEEEMHHGGENPFGDGAERSSLRGVSPRPVEEGGRGKGSGLGSGPGSRKSAFSEGI